VILHVDLDAFFAAVEQRDHPELRGKPVIVGGGGARDRGVVSTASYEARVFGVRSAMPLRTAAALCPQAVFVPVNGRTYAKESRLVMEILRRFTPKVEPISIDEAFLDVAGSEALFGDAPEIARRIRAAVHDERGLTASVGVATTRLVAKIASDLRKPDGLVVVPAGEEAAFLAPLAIERLWGVGPKTRVALADYGVRTIGDLATVPVDLLARRFGKFGPVLHQRARGVDPAPVGIEAGAKSMSHEHTFMVDADDREEIERTLLSLAEGVAGRLRDGGVRASGVALKLRDSDFVTVTRQRTFPEPTDLAEDLYRAVLELARPELRAVASRGLKVRLLGVAAFNLWASDQIGLWAGASDRRHRAAEAIDAVRKKYGRKAIARARLLAGDAAATPAPFERDFSTPPDKRGDG
jgi:nucleotidyltransferase/DNA polymerase involved in DNA repair